MAKTNNLYRNFPHRNQENPLVFHLNLRILSSQFEKKNNDNDVFLLKNAHFIWHSDCN